MGRSLDRAPSLRETPSRRRLRSSSNHLRIDPNYGLRDGGRRSEMTTVTAKKTTERPSALKTICTELKIEPKAARRRLRAAGLKAPYTDAAKIRAALK